MKSLRQGLTRLLLLHLFLAVMAAGIASWLWARKSVLQQFDATLKARAELIVATVEEDDGNLEVEFDLSKLPDFQQGQTLYFRILTAEGTELIASDNFASLPLPSLVWKNTREPQFRFLDIPGNGSYRLMYVGFDAGDDALSKYKNLRLLVIRDAREIHTALSRLAGLVIAVGLVSLVCLWLAVRSSLAKGLKPLENFAKRTGEIDLKQLPQQQIVLENSPAELRPMADKLNELLERVHASLLRERRFTRDVAHELRTPVAELKIIAELATKWADQATPEAFSEIKGIATEMEELVASLTLLNRLDAGSVTPESAPFRATSVIQHIIARCEPRISQKKLRIHEEIAADAEGWVTDPVLWKIATTNLIENAVAYSPTGSEITIQLTQNAFTVKNHAPNLSKEDLEQMRLPFWRKESVRSVETHSGLGISLVESIARALQLELVLAIDEKQLLAISLRKQ